LLKRLLLPAVLLALAPFALAACGDSESDEDRIVETIETSATSTDPADCEALTTVAFMEQTSGGSGKEAVDECEEEAEDTEGDPDSVEVSEVEVDGSEATAETKFEGGNLDGQKLTVALVDEDGEWKLDRLVGFVDFDREGLIAAFKEGLGESEDIPVAMAACILGGLEDLDDDRLESVIINNDEETFTELAEECQ
jgi:hypothetical protein